MTDKLTEALRAKCEEAAREIEGRKLARPQFAYLVAEVIQRHIAPLLQPLRDEVIEECAEIADTTIVKQRIRALKGVR